MCLSDKIDLYFEKLGSIPIETNFILILNSRGFVSDVNFKISGHLLYSIVL